MGSNPQFDEVIRRASASRERPVDGFTVGGKRLSVGGRLWYNLEGPKPQLPYSCDGCSFSPDVWRGYKLWPACVIHDYHYPSSMNDPHPVGRGPRARRRADAILRRNLAALVRLQGGSNWSARRIAWAYWGRVRVWGAGAWPWRNHEKELGRWARLKEVWGRG